MVDGTILESERCWPDFQGGREVLLPDGQLWSFALPTAVMRRGRPGWTFGVDVPPDIDAILSHRLGRILAKRQRAETDADRASTVLEAAWFLLARNYRVDPDEFEAILAPMAGWDQDAQAALIGELSLVVGVAVARATGLVETEVA